MNMAVAVPGGRSGGPPTIADYDHDGLPEVGLAGRGLLHGLRSRLPGDAAHGRQVRRPHALRLRDGRRVPRLHPLVEAHAGPLVEHHRQLGLRLRRRRHARGRLRATSASRASSRASTAPCSSRSTTRRARGSRTRSSPTSTGDFHAEIVVPSQPRVRHAATRASPAGSSTRTASTRSSSARSAMSNADCVSSACDSGYCRCTTTAAVLLAQRRRDVHRGRHRVRAASRRDAGHGQHVPRAPPARPAGHPRVQGREGPLGAVARDSGTSTPTRSRTSTRTGRSRRRASGRPTGRRRA